MTNIIKNLTNTTKISAIVISIILISSAIGTSQIFKSANALPHSIAVAYVTDFGAGLCDTAGPGSGSDVFVNAVKGTPPIGCPGPVATYTTGSNPFGTTASGNLVTFTNVPVSVIDVGGVAALSGFDSVMLYEVCDFGAPAHAGLRTALNSYLVAGGDHKVVIFDGDRCSPISAGTADYSGFLFPFTSSNPGPLGGSGTITFLETEAAPAVLTRALPPAGTFVSSTDAIGDSNTFTSNAGGWCSAQEGTNTVGAKGIQTGYVRTPTGGLAIWNGWDTWFTFGANALDAQIFDNILDQPFNPDSLPCGKPVTFIKLEPLTATNPVGTSHTVTATVTDSAGNPQANVKVTFTVKSGPNVGRTGVGITDASGKTTFTYSDTGGAGTDTIGASFIDSTGGIHNSNDVQKIWKTITRSTTTVTTSSQTGTVVPTTVVTDSATVTGSGPSPTPDLSGTISFQFCGPNPSASTSANCNPAGTVVIPPGNGGTFTANSPPQAPIKGGTYCWTAAFTPTPGSPYTASSSTTTVNECFSVLSSTTQGRMTGGGTTAGTFLQLPVTATIGPVHQGMELHCNAATLPNNLEVNWDKGNKFHLDTLTPGSVFCVNDPTITSGNPSAGFNTYIGSGTGTCNGISGATANWKFTDEAVPSSDHVTMKIVCSTGTLAVADSPLQGNFVAHPS